MSSIQQRKDARSHRIDYDVNLGTTSQLQSESTIDYAEYHRRATVPYMNVAKDATLPLPTVLQMMKTPENGLYG